MKSWFVSDIHLTDLKTRNGETLLRFLFYLNQNPREHRLFLLGDIFDFWLSDGAAFVSHYRELVDQIGQLQKNGGEVIYFEGNHDFHVDVFWTKKLGIRVFENEAHFNIDEMKLRLEHGDFINPNDEAYLKYRAAVRHPWIEPIGHIIPGFFWKWFGEKQSKKSRKRSSHYARNNAAQMVQMIRNYAKKKATEENFDLIVTGHMHIQDDFSFDHDGRQVRSINLGTWLDEPRALRIESNQVEMIDLIPFLHQHEKST